MRRDLSIFVTISSYGVLSVIIISVFIIVVGIYSFSNTVFDISKVSLELGEAYPDPSRYINGDYAIRRDVLLFNSNFSPLAGLLCVGYFLHPVTVTIVRKNIDQRNNERDITMGYLLVCASYVMIGLFGYFGFMGIYFTEYLERAPAKEKPIAQNCIQMFRATDVWAFLLRLVIMPLVGTSFPILQHFFRSGILKLMSGRKKGNRSNSNEDGGAIHVSASRFNLVTAVLLLLPLAIAVFYPQIADLLSYVGAVAGIFAIYLVPISTYLCKLKMDYENPLLTLTNQMNRDFEHKRLYQ